MAERARLGAFRVAKRRDDWLLGRVAAKRVVAAALRAAWPGPWPFPSIEIASEPGGRPCARLAPEAEPTGGVAPGELLPLCVSISHAEGRALCAAVAGAPGSARSLLGVDLCAVEPRSEAFVDTFFTRDEQRFVRRAPARERDARACLVWSAKEAVLKAAGLGLAVDTRTVCCLPRPGLVDPTEWPLAPPGEAWRPFVAELAPSGGLGAGGAGVWRSTPDGFVLALARPRGPAGGPGGPRGGP